MDAETKAYLEQLIGQVNARLDRIETRLDRIETRQDSMQEYMLNFRAETITRFQLLEQRWTIQEATLTSIDLRLPPFAKAIMEFGNVATVLQRGQMDLTERLSKVEEQLRKPAA